MLEVLPIQDKQEQEALCARCEIPFQTELLAYKALVDGTLKVVCQFTMNAEGGRIIDFAAVPDGYEFEPMFVMGRATLNFIDLCGITDNYFDYLIFPDNKRSTNRTEKYKVTQNGTYKFIIYNSHCFSPF